MDRYRNLIVDRFYGKVSESDILIAKRLLINIDDFEDFDYDFLESGYLEGYGFNSHILLKQLIKGHKLNKETIKLFVEIKEIINSLENTKTMKNQKYNEYLFELVELFERNQSEI